MLIEQDLFRPGQMQDASWCIKQFAASQSSLDAENDGITVRCKICKILQSSLEGLVEGSVNFSGNDPNEFLEPL